MEPRIEPTQRQEQRLALTPQVRLGLHILQLSLPELRQFVEHQLEENPVLQEAPALSSESSLPSVGSDEAFGRVGVAAMEQLEQDEGPKTFEEQEEAQDKPSFREHLPTQPLTLREYLLRQLHCLALSPAEAILGEQIIDNLDEHGYLEVPLEELAKDASRSLVEVERCLRLIQAFDPPGVGARDLRECLLTQLRNRGTGEERLAFQIVRDHFELVKKRDLKAIARQCATSLEQVHAAFREIQLLDPKPGRAYGATPVAVLVPDAMIERVDPVRFCSNVTLSYGRPVNLEPNETAQAISRRKSNGVDGTPACAVRSTSLRTASRAGSRDAAGAAGRYEVSLRREEIPRIRISRYYRNLLKDPTAPDEVRQYLKGKVDGALWLMKAIGQRNLTLKAIVQCIACLEEEFLDKGPTYLKPLTLEQVARLVERHKSTVCRAVANKYLQTPWGIVPLERFFGGGLRQDSGAPVAEQQIKAEIRALIEAEEPHKPLTDQKLVDELKARGIAVARRTVAKYREELKILPSHLRKALR